LLYLPLYQAELAGERARTASEINNLLQTSLENAMLKRDIPGLSDMVVRLGQQTGIVSVFITNPSGEIRFASQSGLTGQHLSHPYAGDAPTSQFVEGAQGGEVLRSINPVHNKAPCTECHGPISDKPINGILYVDYDAAPLRHKVRNTTLLLMGAGSLIVLLNLFGGWWFIRQQILRPVQGLTLSSEKLTQGDFSARVEIHGTDEFARLAEAFNLMANCLQEKLRELEVQKAFLQQLVDAIPDGIRVIDPDFNVVLTNRAYVEQLGLTDSDGVGQPCYRIMHDADKPCPPTLISCPVHEVAKHKRGIRAIHHHKRVDGSSLDVEIYAAPMGGKASGEERSLVVESIRDLGKEVKYSQEQRLSELGRLATGVAHEIHNPLASIRLALDAAEKKIQTSSGCPDSVMEPLKLVDREIDNCIEITSKLLKLGTSPADFPELVDVNAALHETLSLLRWQAEENHIQIHERLDASLLRVLASDSELRMVALNLAQNAFHAMPEGGELEVLTGRENDRIVMRFSDTGAGILAKDLPYIFDPFFSRRADDVKGTGLGLSISLAIIKKYGGSIEVESEFSCGSRFTITLPEAGSSLGGDA
jgi:PAS domain S-box-containing protein